MGVAVTFIGLTCWWLTQDRSVPIYDAGDHLATALLYHHMLQTGDLLGPLNHVSQYPPLAHLVGAFAAFVGGVDVAPPIIGENVVFVSLLTLGCYQTGKLLFGARAGLFAAIFVLGSPLLIAQFHVFMLDAPETALVAVSMWLLLASEDFTRTRMVGLAGVAVGCGLLVKVQFPFFLAGIVLIALARGGWRRWRALLLFAAAALVVAAPWYIDHIPELGTIAKLAGSSSGAAPGNLPPTLSSANLTWYFWSTLNSQLFAPLFLLAAGGAIWTVVAVARREDPKALRLEFLVGGFVAWLAITLTPHHDIRYDMPLMPYLAVVATGWIVHLPRIPRLATLAVLLGAVAANTLAVTFGVGRTLETKLLAKPPQTQALPDRVVFYSNTGFLVAGPQRDGDTPGLLRALREDGVTIVVFTIAETQTPDFSFEGIDPLATIAGLSLSIETELVRRSSTVVRLLHRPVSSAMPPPCTRLSNGTGVWVVRLNDATGRVQYYCPFPQPRFYGQF
jgi:4-amino-4-deoxy-L-arabinose transferase-like glycosyltransferase